VVRQGKLKLVQAEDGWWQWRSGFLVDRQLVRLILDASTLKKLHSLMNYFQGTRQEQDSRKIAQNVKRLLFKPI
jgi:hypothetical protein